MALAWCLRLPEITSVITGASRPQQVLDNIKAAELMLSDDLLAQIEQVLAN
jgi:aryl-alcohol dehydrogenase-like predicted oxidoreductase